MLATLYAYLLIGVIISAFLLGLHLYFRKRLANPFSVKSLIFATLAYWLIWPALPFSIYRHKSLTALLEGDDDIATLPTVNDIIRHQERIYELWANPPFCGKYIYSRSAGFRGAASENSIFVFDAGAVAEYLNTLTIKDEEDAFDHSAAIKRWVNGADTASEWCTPVPSEWRYFRYIEKDLVERGIGQCFCLGCNALFDSKHLKARTPSVEAGWNFEYLTCPNDHDVLTIETVHLMT